MSSANSSSGDIGPSCSFSLPNDGGDYLITAKATGQGEVGANIAAGGVSTAGACAGPASCTAEATNARYASTPVVCAGTGPFTADAINAQVSCTATFLDYTELECVTTVPVETGAPNAVTTLPGAPQLGTGNQCEVGGQAGGLYTLTASVSGTGFVSVHAWSPDDTTSLGAMCDGLLQCQASVHTYLGATSYALCNDEGNDGTPFYGNPALATNVTATCKLTPG
jgi:hypothetical protein